MARITSSLTKIGEKQVEKGKLDANGAKEMKEKTLAKIKGTLDMKEVKDCDLIIEAIIEDINLKKLKLHKDIGSFSKPNAILATNTSSFTVIKMAEASGKPSQMVGLHFFNPVQMMGLVEVVSTPKTNAEVFTATMNWVKKIGKNPVACKDTPGFVVNRLLVPYMAQALLMIDRGDASPKDIDAAMQLGAGHPMGPITLADYVGLDTCLAILEGWIRDYPKEPAFVIPKCLKEKVQNGKLGRKSGEGFYKWKGDKVEQ